MHLYMRIHEHGSDVYKYPCAYMQAGHYSGPTNGPKREGERSTPAPSWEGERETASDSERDMRQHHKGAA